MTLRPRLRTFVLLAHVISSVGWLGAVAVFLALSVAGLTSQDTDTVRAAHLAMESIGWFVLVPLSLASLLTGLVQALGTKWGLFWHYWVVVKLVINLVATIVLLLYMQTLNHLAGVAAGTAASSGDLSGLRDPSPVLHGAAALLLLLVAATLSVYKPPGMTGYGQRKQRQRRAGGRTDRRIGTLLRSARSRSSARWDATSCVVDWPARHRRRGLLSAAPGSCSRLARQC